MNNWKIDLAVELKDEPIGKKLQPGEITDYIESIHDSVYDDEEIEDCNFNCDKYDYFIKQKIPLNKLNLDEFSLDDFKVEQFIKMYNKTKNYLPIVVGDNGYTKYDIIDGSHRANALAELGLTEIDGYVGMKENKKNLKESSPKSIWKLDPKVNPLDYKMNDDWNDTRKWEAKVLIANNTDPSNKGKFQEVGYIMFNLKNKTFIPIARGDEHHTGYDLLYDLKVANGYFHLFLWGNNYIYEKKDIPIYRQIFKSLMDEGYNPDPSIMINDTQTRMAVDIKTFVDTGEIDYPMGTLAPNGKMLVDKLKELNELNLDILNTDIEHPSFEKKVDKFIKKSISVVNWFLKDAYPNQLLYMSDSGIEIGTKIKDVFLPKLKSSGNSPADFQVASEIMFGFNSFKNYLHRIIKYGLTLNPKKDYWNYSDIKQFFGDINTAMGEFIAMGEFKIK